MKTPRRSSRRGFLAAGCVFGLAGCVGQAVDVGSSDGPSTDIDGPEDIDLPLTEPIHERVDDDETLLDAVEWGGVSPDGIPSIDEPSFEDAADADARLDPTDIVFGLESETGPRAYPQYILVWHEIVNDRVGDDGLAITYCPLTGTAVCFERGSVEFGVSGQLVNSNLIMFDRATESWWPQVLGTAIDGPLTGWSLFERPLLWTTWDRWRKKHPDTTVLTEGTGYVRSYDRDPYGSYNPPERYYAEDFTLFPSIRRDDRFHPKEVVIGFRTAAGAAAVEKDHLRSERLIQVERSGTPFLFVYDEVLDTAYVYRNPEDRDFRTVGNRVTAHRGPAYAPDNLPLERINAFDAMWFAWHAFYPDSAVIG